MTWEKPKDGYNTAGIVQVKGTADVFGESMDVTASVRVQEAEVTVGANIAKDALTLKQDLTVTSDTLEAIRDAAEKFPAIQAVEQIRRFGVIMIILIKTEMIKMQRLRLNMQQR